MKKEELLKLYKNKNITVKKIAEQFGIERASLYNWLRKYKIPYRKIERKGHFNSHWKGGGMNNHMGYVLIYMPEHPNAMHKRYVLEHRLVMEKKIGRFLKRNEIVHHINGNKADNRIVNLFLTTHSQHRKLHYSEMTKEEINKHCEHMRSFRKCSPKKRRSKSSSTKT